MEAVIQFSSINSVSMLMHVPLYTYKKATKIIMHRRFRYMYMTHMLQERGCIYHVHEISFPPPQGLREMTLGSRGPDL